MNHLILFLILSGPVVIISWRALFKPRSHGFYRFFSWECILWLFSGTYDIWFKNALSVNQVFSWIFLIVSAYFVIAGVITMKRKGKPHKARKEGTLYSFEKTTELVDEGIFSYIRHPLYSSLLFLTWGVCLKKPSAETIIIAAISSAFLFLTALSDEKECIAYFGQPYVLYMKKSKRFVPFLF